MFSLLQDLLFPPRSLTGQSGDFITEDEMKHLQFTHEYIPTAALRSEGFSALDSIIAATSYRSTPLLKKAVAQFKYKFSEEVGEMLGRELSIAALPFEFLYNPVLCPVPLHWRRQRWRGFNQAELLAQHVSRVRAWPMEHLLKRTAHTGQQMKRNREERCHALRTAFRVCTENVPETVVLVDDVCTTGATLEMCATQLKSYGVLHIHGLVVAKS